MGPQTNRFKDMSFYKKTSYYTCNRLTGPAYLDFLVNSLAGLLENVAINDRFEMWLIHDGTPPHFSVMVREHLNQRYNRR